MIGRERTVIQQPYALWISLIAEGLFERYPLHGSVLRDGIHIELLLIAEDDVGERLVSNVLVGELHYLFQGNSGNLFVDTAVDVVVKTHALCVVVVGEDGKLLHTTRGDILQHILF